MQIMVYIVVYISLCRVRRKNNVCTLATNCMHSLACYFGVYFRRCFATWDINTKITHSWPQKQFATRVHTLLSMYISMFADCAVLNTDIAVNESNYKHSIWRIQYYVFQCFELCREGLRNILDKPMSKSISINGFSAGASDWLSVVRPVNPKAYSKKKTRI